MVNGVYTIAKQGLIDGTIDMDTNTIQIALLNTTATFTAADTTMTAVTNTNADRVGATIANDETLAGVSVTDGVFDATDPTWTAIDDGTINAAVVYKFVSNDAGSTPIVWIELSDTVTNGGDITINFDGGANKVFALTG